MALDETAEPEKAPRSDRSPWNWLLIIPIVVPVLTFIELARLAWGLRRRRFAVNDPRTSRTSPPPSWPGRSRVR